MQFKENNSNGFIYMTAPNISAVHAFTTRYGGVSHGIYESMNLRSNLGDDMKCVAKNYDILFSALGIAAERTVFSGQVHGDTIRAITEKDCISPLQEPKVQADGMITDVPGIALIVYTADCIPILLHDPVRGIVGAVHAGWRGTALGIAGKAVKEMVRVYGCNPSNIAAAIGPGICYECYETDIAVPDAMRSLKLPDVENHITVKGEKYHVDLKGINSLVLKNAGVLAKNIAISNECTMCLNKKYWSHRFTSGRRGSQASVIMLKGNL